MAKLSKTHSALFSVATLLAATGCTQPVATTHSTCGTDIEYCYVLPAAHGASDPTIPYSLPKGLLNIVVTSQKGLTEEDGLPFVSIVPDRHARLGTSLDLLSTSHDIVEIKLKDQLLQTVNSDVHDKSPEIAEKAISIITNVLARTDFMKSGSGQQQQPPEKIILTIDPFDADSIGNMQTELVGHQVTIDFMHADGSAIKPIPASHRQSIANFCEASVCYRFLTPVIVKATIKKDGKKVVVARKHALVPDPYTIGGINLQRGACVQRKTDLTFSNGVLTGVKVDKPSELEGCLSIPLKVVEAVAKLPKDIATIRYDNVSKQTDLVEQQNKLLQNQAALAATLAQQKAAINQGVTQ